MITFEEATKKAKGIRKNINGGTEFENGYMFSGSDDNKYIGGFNHTPICIRKSDGKVVDQVTFMLSNPGSEIRDFEL